MSQKINVPTPITAAQLTAIDTNSAVIEVILDQILRLTYYTLLR